MKHCSFPVEGRCCCMLCTKRVCVCVCVCTVRIRDYHCDALAAAVLSHPRLWPFSLNEDVVANNSALSVQRQRELKETEEKRRVEEE